MGGGEGTLEGAPHQPAEAPDAHGQGARQAPTHQHHEGRQRAQRHGTSAPTPALALSSLSLALSLSLSLSLPLFAYGFSLLFSHSCYWCFFLAACVFFFLSFFSISLFSLSVLSTFYNATSNHPLFFSFFLSLSNSLVNDLQITRFPLIFLMSLPGRSHMAYLTILL